MKNKSVLEFQVLKPDGAKTNTMVTAEGSLRLMDVCDIVKKIIGEIDPIGESNSDDERYENLKGMTELIENLLADVKDVARYNKNRHEYSMSRAGKYADNFLTMLGIKE